ncbi:hsp20/alpha crystallin family domain-containing protein [Ditylenchus destructor]|uniref:Hsp20/alpha crystallin family domain-containing protein n=1 Tax=Ditylenchus destructor TaxID=166010 RepID=A0AAD4RA22_9BILA|nr:hsp20/alpha crystallin family domain-containing protein [Ditylenchus destructor]
MASPRRQYFEETEYYVREYESRNGLGREQVEHERRTHGQPFERTLIRDPYYDRGRRDFNTLREKHYREEREHATLPPSSLRSPYHVHYYHPPEPPTQYSQYSTVRAYPREYIRHPPTHGAPIIHPIHRSPAPPPEPTFSPGVQTVHAPHQQYIPVQAQSPSAVCSQVRAGSPIPLTGAGDIENTESGFTIRLNVEHFEPKDIKVSLSGNILSVNGERIDEDKSHEQLLKRSFNRKYHLPDDIRLESVKSFVSDNGTLVVMGSRRTWKETPIDIQIAKPTEEGTHDNVSFVSPQTKQQVSPSSGSSKSSSSKSSKSSSHPSSVGAVSPKSDKVVDPKHSSQQEIVDL